jgi:hypothetical protein
VLLDDIHQAWEAAWQAEHGAPGRREPEDPEAGS